MTQSDPLSPPSGHLLSFLELTQDLDSIYNSYANPLGNHLQDTLDLANNEPAYLARRLRHSVYETNQQQESLENHHQSGLALPLPVVDLENGSYADTDNDISAVESIGDSYEHQMASRDLLLGLLGDRHLSLSDVYRSSDSIAVDHLAGRLAAKGVSQPTNGGGVHPGGTVPAEPTHPAPTPPDVAKTTSTSPTTTTTGPTPQRPAILKTPSKSNINLSTNSLDLAKLVDGTSTDHYHATRTIQDPENPYKYTTLTRGVDDFKFGKSLGEGLYLTVVLATDKHTSTKYAVKILDKRHIIKEKKVKYVNIEKHALNRLANRCGIISLYFTFQDKHRLFFVLEYASNGELLTLIKKYGSLNEDCVRHFSVQLLDAMNFMHSNGVIHRDIKPENILLDSQMRIQITDFGTARLLEKKKKRKDLPLELDSEEEEYPLDVRAKLFVGTAEYVLPELLDSKYCGKPGDLWAFGCIVYQMIAGKPPFKGANEYQTFQRITKLQYAFSAGFPMIVRDLIKQILVLQPLRRFTILQIQRHIFYEGVDWSDFDAIWMSGHPELGPYKMSAKLMMKPALMQQQPPLLLLKVPTRKTKERIPAPSAAGSSSSVQTVKSVQSLPAPSQTTRKPQTKVNPASAAAFALGPLDEDTKKKVGVKKESRERGIEREHNEREPTQALKEAKELKESKEKKRAPADYIPGTNILRPQVNAHAIRTLTAGSRRLKESTSSSLSLSKSKSRVLDVTPISPLEQAWLGYLHHDNERILKIGPVIAQKVTVENFERKYRGLVVDLPLGGLKNGRSNGRFVNLSNGATLRGADEDDESFDELVALAIPEEPKDPSSNDSSKASNEGDLKRLGSTKKNDDSGSTSKRSLFKKLLPVGTRNTDNSSNSTVTSPLEKLQTCSMLITTHGRVLLFLRDDAKQNYKLVLELQLDHPFVQLKEVVSSGVSNKFLLRIVPLTGVFAVKLVETAVVFEVEKFDVNSWTEALLKAKTNEHERKLEVSRADLEPPSNFNTSTGTPNSSAQNLQDVQNVRVISGSSGATGPSGTSGTSASGASAKSASSLRNTTPVVNQSAQFSSSPKLPNILKVVTSPKTITSPKLKSTSQSQSPNQDSEELPHLGVYYASNSPKQSTSEKVKVKASKSVKRKPPPPPSNLNMSTGLSSKDESATLLAAQMAVSSVSGSFSPTQRTSFSKETEAKNWSTPYKSRITHPQQQQQQQQQQLGNPKITSLNSKLLSRSRNK